jgi:hypothetical protein
MAAYQNEGPTITPRSVVPAIQSDGNAFERLQAAMRAGLVTQQEVASALAVKPLEDAARVDQARTQLAVRPRATEQALQMGDVQLQTAKAQLGAYQADPTGIKKHFAQELGKYGLEATGDPTHDRATLESAITTAQMNLDYEKKSSTAVAEGIPRLPGETAQAHVTRASKELPSLKLKLEATKRTEDQRLAHIGKLREAGVTVADDATPDQITTLFAAQRQKETAEKAGAVKQSESQDKRTIYLAEMDASNRTLASLEAVGYKPESAIWDSLATRTDFTNWAASKEGQSYTDARNKWIEAVLRDRSGASISPSEYEKAAKQYFPRPGEDASGITNKKALRAAAEAAMRGTLKAGGLGSVYTPDGTSVKLDSAPPPPAPPTVAPGVLVKYRKDPTTGKAVGPPVFWKADPATGKLVMVNSDGSPIQ